MPSQKRILAWLKQNKIWVIANTDKNLGPCVVKLDQHILDAIVHLNDESTYEKLTEEEAKAEGLRLFKEIWRWTCFLKAKGTITDDEAKYICKHTSANLEDPHGYFYLLYKFHKARAPGKPVPNQMVPTVTAK